MTSSVAPQHIIDNPLSVQGDDCPAAFVGFQEEAVVGVVVEEILGEGGGTEGILQDVEVAFPVGISIGVVFPELVAGEPERSGLVQAIGKLVTGRLPFTCVAGPAADVHPLLAIAGSIGVDGDQADIAFAKLPAPGVDALGACRRETSYSSGVTRAKRIASARMRMLSSYALLALRILSPSSSSQNWSIFSIILSVANRYYRAADS